MAENKEWREPCNPERIKKYGYKPVWQTIMEMVVADKEKQNEENKLLENGNSKALEAPTPEELGKEVVLKAFDTKPRENETR